MRVRSRRRSEYRAYLPRARWIRDANDSYFHGYDLSAGATGYSSQPSTTSTTRPGVVLSAVYGGAVHPTAEGYAAMADATLPAVALVLQLDTAVPEVTQEPAPPVVIAPNPN